MIDLELIEQQCKGAIESGYGHLPVVECVNAVKLMEVISRLRSAESEIDELLSMLRQAEKDASRYRWLRESASTEDHGGFAYNFRLVDAIRYMPGAAPNETMDIDAAIDEAMQCNK